MPLKTELKKTRAGKLVPKEQLQKKPLLFSVTHKEKIFLAKYLAVMIHAGIPIREAMTALLEQANTPSLKFVLGTCIKDIEGGQVLAHCLGQFPRVFDAFFTNVVAVGEESGTLSESLGYLSTQLEKSRELIAKVRGALIYPIIVFVGAIGIGVYLSFFMLPKLIPLFASLGSNLPPTTRALLAFTGFVRAYWPFLFGFVIVAIIGIIILWRVRRVRKIIHHVFILLPVFGAMVKQVQITQLSRILGTLLTAGVKVVPALRITADSMGNLVYQEELHGVANAVERGETIADEMKLRKNIFNQTTISMARVGESTGKLSDSLLTLANFTETEVDHDIKNLSGLIEPIVLIVVGLIVGFVAMAVITPIYQLTQAVSQ